MTSSTQGHTKITGTIIYRDDALNRYLRYTLKTFAVLLGILLVLIAGVFIYLGANKQAIIAKVKNEIAGKLNGEVSIGNIDISFFKNFPSVSVLLENISIKDTLFRTHMHPFFEAEKVYAMIGLGNVFMRYNPLSGVRIDNGQLYVYTDSSGYTNAYLFQPKNTSNSAVHTPPKKVDFESIRLRNVRLVLNDQQKQKNYDFDVHKLNCTINSEDSIIRLKMDNDLMIHSLAFNTLRGSYARETPFEGKFQIQFDKSRQQLSFDDIAVQLKRQSFRLSGQFTFGKDPRFTLKATTKNIDYELAKSLMTPKIATSLSLVSVSKPVKVVTANINGPLKGGEPLVNVEWTLEDVAVASPFVSLQDCSLNGSFTNEIVPGQPRTDPNSRLHFQQVKGIYEGIEVRCESAYVDNLITPTVQCDVKSSFDLTAMNDLLASNTIVLQSGKGKVDITYSGPLVNNSNANTQINGQISISDGVLQYRPRNLQVKSVSGNLIFKNTDVFVTDFSGNVQGNKISMNGSARNLLALVKTNPGRVFIDWNIASPSINLNNFTSLLQKRVLSKQNIRRKSRLGSTARQLDEIVDYANFRFNLRAKELTYSKFTATNVNAQVALQNENWILQNVSLQHAGGSMHLSGSLTEKTNNLYGAMLRLNMDNMDVNKVMYAFNNFGQQGIEAQNLKGKLSADGNVTFAINRYTEQPSGFDGYVNFSLKNGALLHYEPLKKIQTFVFKNRNFDAIYFAELKDKIDFHGPNITINRMEIQSTALTLFVEGVYSLQGKTDLSIQVPISNLKKRDEDYVPENKGSKAKAGMSIFLRGTTDKDGTVGFKLDVFKKFRKSKAQPTVTDSSSTKAG